MKNWILIPLALGAGFLGSLGTRFLSSGEERPSEADPLVATRLDRLAQLVASYEERQRDLEASLASTKMQPVTPPTTNGRFSAEDLDAALERWISANPARLEELAQAQTSHSATSGKRLSADNLASFSLDEIVTQVMSNDSIWNNDDLWEELRQSGRIDEVVAEIEHMAELEPNNPDLQVTLGGAYLQQLFGVGNSPVAGALATKADAAFDNALALDPNHWEARFSKAVSLSNWPAFMGKAGQAIEQFEVLAAQQETQEPHAGFAQTYLFLGNMYQQTGENEKALEAWRKGFALFPDSEALAQQLEINERPR